MNTIVKVIEIHEDGVIFSDGTKLTSDHERDCCENHYLDFDNIEIDDFDGLLFDLSNERFFNRIKNYGIELVPNRGHSVRIPGYGYNNGYYSSELTLVLSGNINKKFDITNCQRITD